MSTLGGKSKLGVSRNPIPLNLHKPWHWNTSNLTHLTLILPEQGFDEYRG